MSNVNDSERLIVLVEARITDLERNMRKASTTTGREFGKIRRDSRSATQAMERDFVRSTSRINNALASTSARIGAFGTGAVAGLATRLAPLAVIGAAGLLGKSFLEKTIAQEAAVAQLNAVLKSTGGVAGVTSQAAQDLAANLQKVTTFGDEAIIPAESLLLTFTKIGQDIFPDATKIVLDMSQALGQDLKSSAIQVGKALQDPVLGVTALRRVGVNFSKDQQKVIADLVKTGQSAKAQQLILKELQTEFGGAAVAARDTLGGALKALGNAFGDTFELHGPEVDGLREKIEELILTVSDPRFTNAMADIGQSLFTAMQNIASAVVAIDGAVASASASLESLNQKLASFGNSSFFKNLNSALGLTNKTPEELAAYGITPTSKLESTTPDARIANAFDVTIGTGEAAASKGDRVAPAPAGKPRLTNTDEGDEGPVTSGGGRASRSSSISDTERQREAVANLRRAASERKRHDRRHRYRTAYLRHAAPGGRRSDRSAEEEDQRAHHRDRGGRGREPQSRRCSAAGRRDRQGGHQGHHLRPSRRCGRRRNPRQRSRPTCRQAHRHGAEQPLRERVQRRLGWWGWRSSVRHRWPYQFALRRR